MVRQRRSDYVMLHDNDQTVLCIFLDGDSEVFRKLRTAGSLKLNIKVRGQDQKLEAEAKGSQGRGQGQGQRL